MKLQVSLLMALSHLLGYGAEAAHPKVQMMTENPIMNSFIVALANSDATIAAVQAKADALTSGDPSITVTAIYESVLQGFAAKMTTEQAEAMAESAEVAYISQDGEVYANDIKISSVDTWGLDRIDQRKRPLDKSYSPYGDGVGVTAYILDTGIRTSHEEFDGGRASWGTNTVGDGVNSDCHGHGTHVAGTVAGKGYGVAKKAKVVAIKVLGCSGSGSWTGVINGINWVKNNAKKPATANISLGGSKNTAVNNAVNDLHNSGVPTVVAAGNSNSDACNYSPGGAADVISVASSTSSDSRSSFSNYGNCVEIVAPGSDIKSAWKDNDSNYRTISGTSMSAPHVCGGAALLLEANVSPGNVLAELSSMATPNEISGLPSGTPNLLLYVGGRSPSRPPTTSPPTTRPPTTQAPTNKECLDSKSFFMWEGKRRTCRWIATKRALCHKDDIFLSFCPESCGACGDYGCADVEDEFYLFKEDLKPWTCSRLANLSHTKKMEKCSSRKKFYTTCRDTCEVC